MCSLAKNIIHRAPDAASKAIVVTEFHGNDVGVSRSTVTRSNVPPRRDNAPKTSSLKSELLEMDCFQVRKRGSPAWYGKVFGMAKSISMSVKRPAGTLETGLA